jgi:hypothetical protein
MGNPRDKCPPSPPCQEEAIENALAAIERGEYDNLAEAARTLDLPYYKLRARSLGRPPSNSRGGSNTTLSEEQDRALCEYINRCIELGRPALPIYIKQAANSILRASGSTQTVSRYWFRRWYQKHPEYHKRTTKPLSADREAAQNRMDVLQHFRKFERAIRDYHIQAENLWNFDETGFRIGCQNGQIVITYSEIKAVYMSDPENRELITSVECVNAAGQTIDPMIVMAGAIIKEKHVANNLAAGILLATSDSGYTNDRLSIEWIKSFDRQTKAIACDPPKDGEIDPSTQKWRMLIMDGHGSHLTIQFVNYCYENWILPYLLPPHSTHLLQPLDVGVFQPLKHHHQVVLEESIRWGGADFDRTEFLACFQDIRQHAFKVGTIRSAWEKAGLVPLNPSRVISQMKAVSAPEREKTPEEQIINWHGELFTPENQVEISQFTDFIELRLEMAIQGTEKLSPHVATAWEKREKAQKIITLSGIIAVEELHKRREKELEKKRRKSMNRQVQKYGIITVGDARLKLVSRDLAEEQRIKDQQEKEDRREVRRKAREEQEAVARVERATAKALKKIEKETATKALKEKKKEAQEVKALERAKKNKIKEAEKAKRAQLKLSKLRTGNKASKLSSKPKKRIILRVNAKGAVKKGSRGK